MVAVHFFNEIFQYCFALYYILKKFFFLQCLKYNIAVNIVILTLQYIRFPLRDWIRVKSLGC